MKLNGKSVGLLLAGLVLLPGCMRVPSYKPKSLQSIGGFTYRSIEKGVVLQAKCLTEEEIYSLFDDRAKELTESVEIIHCSIHNLSKQDYIFSPKNKNFAPLSINEVTRLIKTSSVGRIATGIVGGMGISLSANVLFLGGVCLLVGPMGCVIVPGQLIFGLPIAFTIASLPFFGKAGKSIVMNHRIKKDLKEKMFHKKVVIKSGDTREGLIFVKKSYYQPDFAMTLLEKNNQNNKLIFDIDLAS